MHLLAIETSADHCSCALSVNGSIHESCVPAGHSHSALLLPMVTRLMADAGLAFSQLDAIAFGAGPGSFTGLRIACGAAQGLAFAHDLPVIPVSTLEALALEADADCVLACLDARMGELYLAAYELEGGDLRTVYAPALLKTTALPDLPGDWLGVGSGFGAHAAPLTARYALSGSQTGLFPRAAAVARLAAARFACGDMVPADAAAPIYLRDKVALDVAEQAALRAANQNAAIA
jgi:tRNA threonylcarbamoyladenosine biosynthesis protein TsaB